ncbi:olfactory receptor 11L1-like [Phyllobates terribilis]|uniref:olfactory receptor 11L1-like n=1 Tax=Phyllobates terribilis TaxID=111132 RepID=UPI003CCAF5AB
MKTFLNLTTPSSFHLVGFTDLQTGRIPAFFFFFLIYLLILAGNLLIIFVSLMDVCLHKPMYFFLTHLSFLEVFYTTTVIPKLLQNFLLLHQTISFVGCFTQMYFFCIFGGTESILLAVMAYDRYLAICKPLHYSKLMRPKICQNLTLGSWLIGVFASLIPTVSISKLPFCFFSIDHFFCDLLPVLKLSCSDTWLIELSMFVLTSIMSLGTFSWTLMSYAFIIVSILRMSSRGSQERAFSTCAAHLAVVSIYYGTVITMYMGKGSQNHNKLLSVLYSIVTPLFNPFIYSLRNKEVRKAIAWVFCRSKGYCSEK